MRSRHPHVDRLRQLAPRAQHAEITGSATAWWEYGPPSEDDLIVAIHGFRGDHHGLELFSAYWPEQRFVIPDLPGFGLSSPLQRKHDIEGFRDWLLDFVERVRPTGGRLVILGHSFGSIVVAAALSAGLRVDGAILVNPISAPALHGPKAFLSKLALGYYRAGQALPASMGNALLRNRAVVRGMSASMVKSPEPAMRAFVHEQHDLYFSRFSDRERLGEAFETSVSHNVAEYAEQISVPTLLIAAEHDDITPLQAQHSLAARLPSARLAVIPNVGHLVHYETPAVAVEHMRAFWEQLP